METISVEQLEDEIKSLKQQLEIKEQQLAHLKKNEETNPYCNKLSSNEVARYSRQIILPNITIKGQITLNKSSVLIVGAGGLGCVSALYLTAAGIGRIGIIDYDNVELSNLHRQILHWESNVGESKVISAQQSLFRLNSNVKIEPIQMHLNASNVMSVVEGYDVIVDGSDNVATRYLLSDACVFLNKPLVSGAALRQEGQLTVYNYNNGPCLRCLFPNPPSPETVTNCSDVGVLGAVVGCIGTLQALETIKILLNSHGVLSERMLLFDGSTTTFRNVTLRKPTDNCVVCGCNPIITKPVDYELFCQAQAHDKGDFIDICNTNEQITISEFKDMYKNTSDYILIDVRPRIEFDMCNLTNSINFPFTNIEKNPEHELLTKLDENESNEKTPVFVICRRGNDSQRAVKIFQQKYKNIHFRDIKGGLHAFSEKIDSRFPVY